MKNNNCSTIAKNLKLLKKKKGLSQSDLCKKANLAYHTIAKIEAGSTTDPRISTLKKIADALNVSIDTLIGKNK